MTRTATTLIAIAMASLAVGAPSGSPAKKQALLMAMGSNAKQITQYQWKQKITVIRKGTPLEPTIQEVRFDASGQPMRTILVKPEEKKMGPLRARKAAEIKESVQETIQLALRYAHPKQLAEAIQGGELWEGPTAIRVHTRAVLLPIDEVDIAVHTTTFLAAKVDVKSRHEGAPVSFAIVYDQLPNGPSVMRRMTVQIPEEDIVVSIESFDFVRLAGQTIH